MPKLKTSQCRKIDIRDMKRSGLIELLELDGWVNFHWKEFASPVTVMAVDQGLTISHRDRHGMEIKSLIPILRTDCHMNGSRPWFGCPVCGRRVAILYSVFASKFACRTCFNLAYPSQSEGAENRAIRRYNTIRRRLGWKPGFLNGYGDKPTGMHWRNFKRLKAEHDVFMNASLACFP
jgi:hypothetical protein